MPLFVYGASSVRCPQSIVSTKSVEYIASSPALFSHIDAMAVGGDKHSFTGPVLEAAVRGHFFSLKAFVWFVGVIPYNI
jgi:hypothetical protein